MIKYRGIEFEKPEEIWAFLKLEETDTAEKVKIVDITPEIQEKPIIHKAVKRSYTRKAKHNFKWTAEAVRDLLIEFDGLTPKSRESRKVSKRLSREWKINKKTLWSRLSLVKSSIDGKISIPHHSFKQELINKLKIARELYAKGNITHCNAFILAKEGNPEDHKPSKVKVYINKFERFTQATQQEFYKVIQPFIVGELSVFSKDLVINNLPLKDGDTWTSEIWENFIAYIIYTSSALFKKFGAVLVKIKAVGEGDNKYLSRG